MKRFLIAALALACSSKEPHRVENPLTTLVLSLLPSSVSLPQGRTVPVTVTLGRSAVLVDPVTISASGLPSGVSASPLVISGNSGTLNLSASETAPVTRGATVTVTGSTANGDKVASATLNLTVTVPRFSLTVAPPTLSISRGSTRSATVHVIRDNFAGVIIATVSGLPAGVTPEPLSISGNLGNLVFHVARDAEEGAFPLTVSGVSGSIRANAPLGLLVTEAGALDPNFGDGSSGTPGLVITALDLGDAGTESTPTAVAVQPDQKIVVVGNRTRSGPVGTTCAFNCSGIAVARYTPDGTLDTTFVGDGGTADGGVPPPPGALIFFEAVNNQDDASAVAISDAGILIVSRSNSGPDTLIRLTSDGLLDPSFNPDGGRPGRAQKTINATAVAVIAEEKILVAGQTPAPIVFALARYNSDGTLDTTFGDGGVLSRPWGLSVTGPVVTGAIFTAETAKVVGRVTFGGQAQVAVVSFDITDGGSNDISFNDGGLALIQLGFSSSGAVAGLDVQGNSVVVARANPTSSHADIALVSFQPDGGLDPRFGTDGVARTLFDPDAGNANISGAATSGDKIVAVGNFTPRTTSDPPKFLVVRYNSDGTPDKSFGVGGSGVIIDAPSILGAANTYGAVTFQADGKMVAVGGTSPPGQKIRFAVVRFLP